MEIKNDEQYIILEISSKLDCLDKREAISSCPKDYIGRPGKGLTTSLALRNKIPNKEQKARFDITEITDQDFSKLLKKFDN